ncbi:hypothetical protein FRB99_007563 [Tulasnella sp. 403]|nr:hypothetical protein FRB99_007563 [Tulasnella sp. 403]
MDYYVRLLKLCSVSFDWAYLIRDTPSFWVYTRSVDRQELTDLILERSRTSLLWVEYNATRSKLPSRKKLAKYVKAVRRESCRWRTLVLRLGDPPYILSPDSEELGAAMFPKLSHLLILSHKGAFARLPYFFKCGKPPLKYLQVGGVELDWDQWPSHPELEVLRLCNNENEGLNIGYSQLCRIVDTSLSLKSLEIHSVYISHFPKEGTHTSLSSSTKPVLDKLELINVEPAQVIPPLLDRVELHGETVASIAVPFCGRNTTVETEDACCIVGTLSRHLSSLTSQSLYDPLPNLLISTEHAGDEHFVITYDAGAMRLNIATDPTSLDPTLRSQSMGLNLQLEPTLGGLVHKLDDHLSNVSDLAILEPGAFVLDDLCASPDAPITEWVFPKITHLYLQLRYRDGPRWDVTQVYPMMVPMLCKLARARPVRTGNSSGEVMALETFELRGKGKVQKRDVEQLEAVIPEVRAGYGMEIVE